MNSIKRCIAKRWVSEKLDGNEKRLNCIVRDSQPTHERSFQLNNANSTDSDPPSPTEWNSTAVITTIQKGSITNVAQKVIFAERPRTPGSPTTSTVVQGSLECLPCCSDSQCSLKKYEGVEPNIPDIEHAQCVQFNTKRLGPQSPTSQTVVVTFVTKIKPKHRSHDIRKYDEHRPMDSVSTVPIDKVSRSGQNHITSEEEEPANRIDLLYPLTNKTEIETYVSGPWLCSKSSTDETERRKERINDVAKDVCKTDILSTNSAREQSRTESPDKLGGSLDVILRTVNNFDTNISVDETTFSDNSNTPHRPGRVHPDGVETADRYMSKNDRLDDDEVNKIARPQATSANIKLVQQTVLRQKATTCHIPTASFCLHVTFHDQRQPKQVMAAQKEKSTDNEGELRDESKKTLVETLLKVSSPNDCTPHPGEMFAKTLSERAPELIGDTKENAVLIEETEVDTTRASMSTVTVSSLNFLPSQHDAGNPEEYLHQIGIVNVDEPKKVRASVSRIPHTGDRRSISVSTQPEAKYPQLLKLPQSVSTVLAYAQQAMTVPVNAVATSQAGRWEIEENRQLEERCESEYYSFDGMDQSIGYTTLKEAGTERQREHAETQSKELIKMDPREECVCMMFMFNSEKNSQTADNWLSPQQVYSAPQTTNEENIHIQQTTETDPTGEACTSKLLHVARSDEDLLKVGTFIQEHVETLMDPSETTHVDLEKYVPSFAKLNYCDRRHLAGTAEVHMSEAIAQILLNIVCPGANRIEEEILEMSESNISNIIPKVTDTKSYVAQVTSTQNDFFTMSIKPVSNRNASGIDDRLHAILFEWKPQFVQSVDTHCPIFSINVQDPKGCLYHCSTERFNNRTEHRQDSSISYSSGPIKENTLVATNLKAELGQAYEQTSFGAHVCDGSDGAGGHLSQLATWNSTEAEFGLLAMGRSENTLAHRREVFHTSNQQMPSRTRSPEQKKIEDKDRSVPTPGTRISTPPDPSIQSNFEELINHRTQQTAIMVDSAVNTTPDFGETGETVSRQIQSGLSQSSLSKHTRHADLNINFTVHSHRCFGLQSSRGLNDITPRAYGQSSEQCRICGRQVPQRALVQSQFDGRQNDSSRPVSKPEEPKAPLQSQEVSEYDGRMYDRTGRLVTATDCSACGTACIRAQSGQQVGVPNVANVGEQNALRRAAGGCSACSWRCGRRPDGLFYCPGYRTMQQCWFPCEHRCLQGKYGMYRKYHK